MALFDVPGWNLGTVETKKTPSNRSIKAEKKLKRKLDAEKAAQTVVAPTVDVVVTKTETETEEVPRTKKLKLSEQVPSSPPVTTTTTTTSKKPASEHRVINEQEERKKPRPKAVAASFEVSETERQAKKSYVHKAKETITSPAAAAAAATVAASPKSNTDVLKPERKIDPKRKSVANVKPTKDEQSNGHAVEKSATLSKTNIIEPSVSIVPTPKADKKISTGLTKKSLSSNDKKKLLEVGYVSM